jgi:hypothetical protein
VVLPLMIAGITAASITRRPVDAAHVQRGIDASRPELN